MAQSERRGSEPRYHPSMPRAPRPILVCVTLLSAACGPTPIELAPLFAPPPPVEVRGPAHAQPLQVAVDPQHRRRFVTVDATRPRTLVGHFPAGARVRIRVVEARWNNDGGAVFFGAAGSSGQRCGGAGHACVGDDTAPMMGLFLITAPSHPAPEEVVCAPQHRLFVPQGVELAVPEESEIALGPNDWEDGLENNRGALQVDVEVAVGQRGKALWKKRVDVPATVARTSLGRFQAGQYLRISVAGGQWSNDPGAPLYRAAGAALEPCRSQGAHRCPSGDANLPMMGLVLSMGACLPAARAAEERRYVPVGAEVTLLRESDLFLGPNDWEDGCANNAGAVSVEVETDGR